MCYTTEKFVGMLDLAIDLLGPDMDLVEEQLQHLGVAHIGYGVMPKHYPLMGKALADTIETKLGDKFTEQGKQSVSSRLQPFENYKTSML